MTVKGWCPGALRPMLSGDGYLLRLRPHGGRLSQVQARAAAQAALDHGNGLVELTSRANLQLRGVTQQSHPHLLAALQAYDLIDTDIASETRRNIIVTPFADAETDELVASLENALTASNLSLPAKFGFAIDTGPRRVLAEASADIRIERGLNGLILRADGMATGAALTSIQDAIALATWFLDQGGAVNNRGRMAGLIARGIAPIGANEVPVEAVTVGPGETPQGVLLGFEFGQIEAEVLDRLSELGSLRLTPWRMVLIENLTERPDIPGLIHSPNDPRLRLHACIGAPRCPHAHTDSRALIRSLAPFLPAGQHLHVSGCAKGCGWPRRADLTVTATAKGFDLIRNGCAGDSPELTGQSAAELSKVF